MKVGVGMLGLVYAAGHGRGRHGGGPTPNVRGPNFPVTMKVSSSSQNKFAWDLPRGEELRFTRMVVMEKEEGMFKRNVVVEQEEVKFKRKVVMEKARPSQDCGFQAERASKGADAKQNNESEMPSEVPKVGR